MNNTELILAHIQDGIGTLIINRPDKLNALNKDTINAIHLCLESWRVSSEVRVVIISGSGNKAFVAGADIAEFAHFNQIQGRSLAEEGQAKLFDTVAHFPKPVIAAMNGFALGGGLELAMAAHIRIASITAKMGLPEVSLGLIPGYGGTQRLPQLIGKGRAFEMIFSGAMITAEQALNFGLVNQITEPESLMDVAKTMASQFMKNSSSAIAASIAAVNAGFVPKINGFEAEKDAFGSCFGSPEFLEGTTAFLEKRKPDFSWK
jgi:enoyl-CoA hydratase